MVSTSIAALGLGSPALASTEAHPSPITSHESVSNDSEKAIVASSSTAVRMTSSDSRGKVSATIAQPGRAISPADLPPERLASAGSRIEYSAGQRLTTAIEETLQHVEFDEQTAFPVIADPQWWQMGISAAAGAAAGAAVVASIPGVGPTVLAP